MQLLLVQHDLLESLNNLYVAFKLLPVCRLNDINGFFARADPVELVDVVDVLKVRTIFHQRVQHAVVLRQPCRHGVSGHTRTKSRPS